jgi:serine protease AprX
MVEEIIVEFECMDEESEAFILSCGKIKSYLPMINSYVVEISAAHIDMLKQHKGVIDISENTALSAQMNNGRRTIGADAAHRQGLSGKGVTIAFLDTGIAKTEDFILPKNRIIAFKDFLNKHEEAYDDNGHGTHVAGISSGNGYLSNGKYSGIAYDANIAAVKVLDAKGNGDSVLTLKGIQWVIDMKERLGIRIMNLSLGSAVNKMCDPLVKAVNAAWDNGIVVTAASGNNGPDTGTVTSPGISRKIITVGASDDNNQVQVWGDTLVNFSGRGPTKECIVKPDVLAPGAKIISALSPGSALSRDTSKVVNAHYVKLSGTSMAAPMVTGAAALLLQRHPNLTPNQVKLALKLSSVDLSYPKNHQGWGLININKLLDVDIGLLNIK